MKKKNITLVFVAIVFSIIVGMIIGKSLLKYKEDEPADCHPKRPSVPCSAVSV